MAAARQQQLLQQQGGEEQLSLLKMQGDMTKSAGSSSSDSSSSSSKKKDGSSSNSNSSSSSSSKEKLKLAGALCLFLLGYCGQPIIVDLCRYQGLASASTFLYLLPHFMGMVIAGALPLSKEAGAPKARAQLKNPYLWRRAFRLALIDLTHQLLEKGVYIFLSSTSVVWTAALSALILGRGLLQGKLQQQQQQQQQQ
ncbi:hypothetical protein, conserved [Eimeria brunetti]|uniref:Uncharacterized protein n=1 Tax=Eimeria brunetti TaxID=51314 RepID=U6LJV5_9EIME|nr:hypothetical protein, conserved [Eimeria brunetti]